MLPVEFSLGLRALRKQRSVACLHKDSFFYVIHSALKNANKSADFRNFTDFLQILTSFEFFLIKLLQH